MPGTRAVALAALLLCVLHAALAVPNYQEVDRDRDDSVDEYGDNLERLLENTQKRAFQGDRREDYPIKLLRYGRRSCLARGQRCDHRPNDCCVNSTCRCNLWGSNCFCQRMGLFQQWGK